MFDQRFIAGVDLGQAQDPTAIAVGELAGDDIQIRHLERRPLGEPYPDIIGRVAVLIRALPGLPDLVVDATGVGRPVIDMMRDKGLAPIPVTITAGRGIRQVGRKWLVPKPILLLPLITAVETGRFKIAAGLPFADVLTAELRAFQRRVTRHANEQFEGRGEHDDLVSECFQPGCMFRSHGGHIAGWGAPTGVALAADGRSLVLGQWRLGSGGREERLIQLLRSCRALP